MPERPPWYRIIKLIVWLGEREHFSRKAKDYLTGFHVLQKEFPDLFEGAKFCWDYRGEFPMSERLMEIMICNIDFNTYYFGPLPVFNISPEQSLWAQNELDNYPSDIQQQILQAAKRFVELVPDRPRLVSLDLDEIVLLIFALCGHEYFSASEMNIYPAIYAIWCVNPSLFPGIIFDTNGNYPTSEQLDNVLSRLKFSGLLAYPAHVAERSWYVAPAGICIDNLVNQLQREDPMFLQEIQRAAAMFAERVPQKPETLVTTS